MKTVYLVYGLAAVAVVLIVKAGKLRDANARTAPASTGTRAPQKVDQILTQAGPFKTEPQAYTSYKDIYGINGF